MNFGCDEVSQTHIHISKSPGQQTGYAGMDRGCGIVSVHRMKPLFCDDCIREILETVGRQLIEGFFIYDTEESFIRQTMKRPYGEAITVWRLNTRIVITKLT